MKLSIKIEIRNNRVIGKVKECEIPQFIGLSMFAFRNKGNGESNAAALANAITLVSSLVYDRIKHGTLVEVSNDKKSWETTRYISRHRKWFKNCHCVVDPQDSSKLALYKYVRNIQIKEKDGVYTWEK